MLNITAIQIFADAMGMTEAEMFKQMELGKVLAEDVLPAVGREFSRVARSNGALEAATAKVNSQFQRFLNSLLEAKLALFEGGFGQSMSNIFQTLTKFINTTNVSSFGAMVGGMLEAITGALVALALPLQGVINLFSLIFGEDGSKWAGYALGIALVASKVMVMTKAVWGLVVASRALALTPVGFALTALGVGAAAYGANKYLSSPAETAAPKRSAASEIAQQYSQPQRQDVNVNVRVTPDENEFGRVIRTQIVNNETIKKSNLVSETY